MSRRPGEHTIQALFTHEACVAVVTNEFEALHQHQRRSLQGADKRNLATTTFGSIVFFVMVDVAAFGFSKRL